MFVNLKHVQYDFKISIFKTTSLCLKTKIVLEITLNSRTKALFQKTFSKLQTDP